MAHRLRLFAAALLATTAAPLPSTATAAAPTPRIETFANAHWIWFPDSDPVASAPAATRYLQRTFTAPAGPYPSAELLVTGDDTIDVWLNGTWLAGSPRAAHSWRTALHVDLAAALRPGSNTLTFAARNAATGPAGVLGRVRVVGSGGGVDLVTDGSWQAADTVPQSWVGARDLGPYGSGPWRTDVAVPPVGASPVTVGGLTTERRTDPVGVDTAKPRFGWRLSTAAKGQLQGRYQVTVGTTPGAADVWDSGTVASQQSVDVGYGGPALAADRTYHWRVRVWDGQGRPSPWSAPARFDTAPAGWDADFIGAPGTASLTGASWIWYPEGDPAVEAPAAERFFRRTFDLAAPGATTLVVTGDDTADVWLNGTRVVTSRRVADSWQRATTIDVTAHLRTGVNVLAVAARNTSASPAGVLATLRGAVTLGTDAAWTAAQTAPDGWQRPGFDDGAWPAARVAAAHPGGPWGDRVVVPNPAPVLGKTFTVAKPVARARLFATALGLHETYLNGAKVSEERLAPGWTDYTKRLQYRGYDVTAALRQGDNTLSALVGNGWYSGSLGMAGSRRYGTSPWYSAQLVVEYADGTRAEIRTDGSWSATTSPVVADDLYHGEDQDARIAGGTGRPVTVRTGARPNLVAQVDPGVTVQQELRPVRLTQPKPGVWIADLGQNFAGWNRLRVNGPAGTTVTLRHGELLNADGTLYTANLRAAQQTDTFTLAGRGTETFEPHFTVHGYRYVELTGFPGTPTADSLTGLAAWTTGAETGTFTTSDPLVNQLQHNILWGARSNMLSIPTDCPQRDERLGWTGDIAAFGATATFNFDTHGLLAKFADDLVDGQRADGAFPDVAPDVFGWAGKAGWGDAGVIVPYVLWQRYGDLSAADRHFDAMAKWVDYLRGTAGADLIRDQDTYGDWLHVDDPTPNDVTSTAFFGWSARLVSRMAAATGRTAQATAYGDLADRIGAAFTARFVRADGTVATNSQTGYVLALAFGLVPGNREQAVADRLAAKVASRNGHLSVGFMGVENLLPVLAEHGHLDTAYQILQQPDYPGWGYMNSRGATTIWERWDGIRTDGSLQDVGMNSFNHYGLGSVGDWLYRTVGGLGPAAPGYQRLLIAPKPGGSLTSATTSLTTGYGPTRTEWRRAGPALTLTVVVPPNTTATVQVPASSAGAVTAPAEAVPQGYTGGVASYALPSGSYTFTVG
ncbi:family 78 glycoside hydrolase catalytic domain [Jidongwangia harbinensis]|uniref:family 78 glycoside hydrolase catalytic domain n=1 Tax=Jidongwangia harbinensis TaxID=2878561 RepID=UPI001CDA320B|nr:alpha-L-rhamnosidase [Jidongwangia harbinensis]MCA2211861.1 glycoside hydrolase family 78 protein [Jidongwangia harbinensis]